MPRRRAAPMDSRSFASIRSATSNCGPIRCGCRRRSKNVSPRTALSVGLKVDSDALPPEVINAIKAGQVNLDDPSVTIQLLKLNAVIGVIGRVIYGNMLKTVGITCALCHTQVDNSVAPGIGRRLDGWPNRSLNVGAIIALSPAVTNKAPFQSWGPGK